MNLRKGRALPPGGTIGIVTPASPYNQYSDVLKGIAWWEARGCTVKLAEHALERTDYTAGSPEHRAQDLMAMFADPDVSVVQCLRGGYGSAQMIPHVDFQVIAAHPKPFIGFSDITALHCALLRFANLVTFYGPSLTLGPVMSEFTEKQMFKALKGEAVGEYPKHPDDPFVFKIAGGRSTGRLVGGCLSDLLYTMGTPWEFDLDGAIFFFEEVGSSPHTIDRALLQLTQAGKFNGVRGIVIGELKGCEWDDGDGSPFPHTKVLEDVLADRLGALGVPVIYGLPFGHGDQFATLPTGVLATIDGDAGTLTITELALVP